MRPIAANAALRAFQNARGLVVVLGDADLVGARVARRSRSTSSKHRVDLGLRSRRAR